MLILKVRSEFYQALFLTMYSADSLKTQYITDPIAVYSSQVKRNEVMVDNTVS